MSYNLEEDTTLYFVGGPLVPKGWAIHWWGDPAQNPTFDGIKSVLVNRSAAESASVNFMSEAGRVACLVSPFTIAWAQGDGGDGWGNNNLVSVENNPRCSEGDRETLAELIADQHIQNGIPIVLYPHKKFTQTQCPGVWEQWIPSITERAKQIVAEKQGQAAPAPVVVAETPVEARTPLPNAGHSDNEIHWNVDPGDTLYKIGQYYGIGYKLQAIADYNNIGVGTVLHPGDKVFIPGPLVWNIEAPDSLISVAAYYGLDADYLAQLNGLPDRNAEIYIGNQLKII